MRHDVARAKRLKIEKIQRLLQKEMLDVQSGCDHTGHLTYKRCSAEEAYTKDYTMHNYWLEWKCHDCGKSWSTPQLNSYDLIYKKYRNAVQIK